MANLFSSSTRYAGQFGPISLVAGNPLAPLPSGTVVTVFQSDGTTSAQPQMWQDYAKTTPASSNQITIADAFGTVQFWADPGEYVLSFLVAGTVTTRTVVVSPLYPDASWNVVIDTTVGGGSTFTPLSGDSRLCNTTAGNATYNLSASVLGARFKFAHTDSSANTLTITAAAGDLIYGPGLSTGQASITLNSPGAYVELHGDGNHGWHVVAGNAAPPPGQLLARTAYNPIALTTYSTASTTVALIDGSHNLDVSFQAPPSGAVIFRISATMELDGAVDNSATGSIWDQNANSELNVSYRFTLMRTGTGNAYTRPMTRDILVSGLTSGASLKWSPAWLVLNTSLTAYAFAGQTVDSVGRQGQFVVEVVAA